MNGKIFLVDRQSKLVPLVEAPYESEDLLQTLLADYPDLLAGELINSDHPRRWLLIKREAGIPGEEAGYGRWSVDHLFVDQDAIPTLVEVKRSSNTGIRRQVVGQLLEYAANAVSYWPVEKIRSEFELRCVKDGILADQALYDFLGPEADEEAFWQKASFPTENCLEPFPHKVTSAFPVDCADDDAEGFDKRLAQVISQFLERHPVSRYVKSYISLYSMGGAIRNIAPTESAFWFRNKPFVIQIESWWSYPESQQETCRKDPSWQEPYIDWVRNFRKSLLDARLIEGAFINFADADLELAEYYGGNLERLQREKSKWDPSNFFRFEMSIPPGLSRAADFR